MHREDGLFSEPALGQLSVLTAVIKIIPKCVTACDMLSLGACSGWLNTIGGGPETGQEGLGYPVWPVPDSIKQGS